MLMSMVDVDIFLSRVGVGVGVVVRGICMLRYMGFHFFFAVEALFLALRGFYDSSRKCIRRTAVLYF